MNKDLSLLQRYPFEMLTELKQGLQAPAGLDHIALSIGEPRHAAPKVVIDSLVSHLHQLSTYPSTRGSEALRAAISAWLAKRFGISAGQLDPDSHVLPVSGTREALFSIAQCLVDRSAKNPLLFMPNPFYQIYEGAALLAGASPRYLDCLPENDFLPDLDSVAAADWADCQMIYICNPGNPTGAVMPPAYLRHLIELAHRYDFVIASDECYSEIYFDEDHPPAGLLGVAAQMGNDSFSHCLAFNSLSKRSSLPGLRSGFVAGDAGLLEKFLLYRTYHGCALPPATQTASTVAWQHEAHVIENRRLYGEKIEQVSALLSDTLAPQKPQAGFFIWAQTPISDTEFTRRLFAEQNVTVLPGRYLARDSAAGNPGQNRVRMALVAPLDECLDAARRINSLLAEL